MKKIPIVIIGGGMGTSPLLAALKTYPLDITVIASTADSGGSGGALRKELGIIPLGDISKFVGALTDFSPLTLELWKYRFTQGSLKGHALGNIIMAALVQKTGSIEQALKVFSKLHALHGSIIPMSHHATTLCVRHIDGTVVCDEHAIDEPQELHGEITNAYLQEAAPLHPKAQKAIKAAKLIVFAPGDLYTSTIPCLLTTGAQEAFAQAKAPLIYIANLMTSRGETDGFSVTKLVHTLESYLGGRKLDMVILNTDPIPSSLEAYYKKYGQTPTVLDTETLATSTRVIRASLLSKEKVKPVQGDVLQRSMVRHDPKKLAKCIMNILKNIST